MGKVTNVEQTKNQLITNYDVSKFLLGFNSFVDGDLDAGGPDVELLQGMIMARVAATGKIVTFDSAGTAGGGSDYPVGVCVVDQTISAGTEENVLMVNKGKIAESKINFFEAGDSLDTVVGVKTVRDWLNVLGLELAGGEELTKIDNQ